MHMVDDTSWVATLGSLLSRLRLLAGGTSCFFLFSSLLSFSGWIFPQEKRGALLVTYVLFKQLYSNNNHNAFLNLCLIAYRKPLMPFLQRTVDWTNGRKAPLFCLGYTSSSPQQYIHHPDFMSSQGMSTLPRPPARLAINHRQQI